MSARSSMRLKLYAMYSVLFLLGMWAASPADHDAAIAAQLMRDIASSTHQ